MKIFKFSLLTSCLLLLFGCGEKNQGDSESDLTGHIVSMTDSAILVTGSNEENHLSATAIQYTVDDDTVLAYASGIEPGLTLDVGMKVEVWNQGAVAESFPARAAAAKVIFDDSQSAEERIAIQQALQEVEAGYPWHIQKVERRENTFVVTMRNLLSDEAEVEVEVGTKGALGSDLEETKIVKMVIEGSDEEMIVHLHHHKSLGFYAYVPEDMAVESDDEVFNVYANFGDQINKDARLFVMEYDEKTTNDVLKNQGFTLNAADEHAYPFSEKEFELRKEGAIGRASIFTRHDRKYALAYYYPVEYADGFNSRSHLIVKEMAWASSENAMSRARGKN